jgi:hypothetical protein
MESNNYVSFITDIVETMLPRFTDDKIVLAMCVNSNYSVFEGDESFDERERYIVAFHRPSNYTKVFLKKLDNKFFLQKICKLDEIEFDLLSDHDSCWTSDGMRWIFKSFIDMREKAINEGFEYNTLFKSGNWRFSFDIFGGRPKYYEVEIKKGVDWKCNLKFKKEIPIQEIGPFLGKG